MLINGSDPLLFCSAFVVHFPALCFPFANMKSGIKMIVLFHHQNAKVSGGAAKEQSVALPEVKQ